MVQFAPFFQFAQQMDADAKITINARRWSKQGGFKQKKELKNYNSQTIAKGSRRQHNNVKSTRSLDKGTWRMLEPHEKQVFILVGVSANS